MRKAKPNNEFCSNEECPDYRIIGSGNVIRMGKDRNGRQKYRCTACKKYFIETKNTPFYRKHLKEVEIILLCKLMVEKNSIRSMERITEHHRDTIGNLINDLAKHIKKVNDFLLQDVKLTRVELDEFWTYIKKSKRNLPMETRKMLETVTRMLP